MIVTVIETVIETDCPRFTRRQNMAVFEFLHLAITGDHVCHSLENIIGIPFLSKSSIACCTVMYPTQ